MRHIVLTTSEQLHRYNEIYHQHSGRKASDELLANGLVRVFLDDRGEWISGYCVNSKGPLQYLACIEQDILAERLTILGIKREDFVETIAMWRRKDKINHLQRVGIYWQCFSDAKETGKSFLLAGTFEERILSTHNLVCKKTLFQGVLHHRNHSQKGWIYYEHTSLIHFRLAVAAVKEVFKRKKKTSSALAKVIP